MNFFTKLSFVIVTLFCLVTWAVIPVNGQGPDDVNGARQTSKDYIVDTAGDSYIMIQQAEIKDGKWVPAPTLVTRVIPYHAVVEVGLVTRFGARFKVNLAGEVETLYFPMTENSQTTEAAANWMTYLDTKVKK